MKQCISISIFICAIFSISLVHGMNHMSIVDYQSSVWDVLLRHGVKWFNYIAINKLAASSKKIDLIVRETADHRKNYLTTQHRLPKHVRWHKYGAIGGCVKHDVCLTCFPKEGPKVFPYHGLHRGLFYLNEEGMSQSGNVSNGGFDRCLPCPRRRPFFNNKGEFCFYGYGNRELGDDEQDGKVVGYYFAPYQKSYDLCCWQATCMTNIKNKKSELIGLEMFLEFPVLLNAFLKSCVVYKKKTDWWENKDVYAIEGVNIPENYEYHKQYFSTMKYNSFNGLPKFVQRAIVGQYKLQPKKQEKMGKGKIVKK